MSEKMYTFLWANPGRRQPFTAESRFSSENVYKDAALLMGRFLETHPGFSGTLRVRRDEDGANEDYYVVRRDGSMFITYPRGRDGQMLDDFVPITKPKYLVCLDEKTNEYKYYTLTVAKNAYGEETCVADYGRLGAKKGTTHLADYDASKDGSTSYPLTMFWVKYYEKSAKGYADRTEEKDFDNATMKVSGGSKQKAYAPISEEAIAEFVKLLIEAQQKAVEANYELTVPSSHAAIDKAKEILSSMQKVYDDYMASAADGLATSFPTKEFMRYYRDLVLTIPRRIDNVSEYLSRWNLDANDEAFLGNVLDEEAALLLNFIDVYNRDHGIEKKGKLEEVVKDTILSANGLTADYVPYRERFVIEDRLRAKNGRGQIEDDRHKIKQIIAIRNQKTDADLEASCKRLKIPESKRHLLFHGSGTQNWWSIITGGLQVRYAANGMFGRGIYFAPLGQKSLGYTSILHSRWANGTSSYGVLGLFDVAMGNPKKETNAVSNPLPRLQNGKYDSIWAKATPNGLYNDECIVYEDGRASIRYLVLMDGTRQTFKNITYENARKLVCYSPYYDEKKEEIVFLANLSDVLPDLVKNTDACHVRYHVPTRTLRIPKIEGKLYGNEMEYLRDVVESNFAENPREFRAWQQDIIADAELTNPHGREAAKKTKAPKESEPER